MERSITGYHRDEHGDWVAELDCGHNQHVRHQPPWQLRPWVNSADGRREHLGTLLSCVLCDRRELPTNARRRRVTRTFDDTDMPAGLRSRHTTRRGVWAVIHVLEGRLAYRLYEPLAARHELGAGESAALPPELEHEVEPLGPVRFHIEFLNGRQSSD